jgi:integrase
MRVTLTDALIRGLKPPTTDRTELTDAACRGLGLRVTPAGVKTFRFTFRLRGSGRVERVTIGRYPDVSLRIARAKADKLRQQVTAGENPSAHKREAAARSFTALARRYLDEHARRHKRSAAKDDRNLRLHILPRWGNRDFTTITRADVVALIERLVSADKPVLANHVHRLISGIFNFAMDFDLASANPAARLRKRGTERVKTRVLTDDEIRLLWHRVIEPPIPRAVGLALRLVLAVGVRPGEAASMARSEIEFNAEGVPVSWTVPSIRSKNRRAHFAPLPPLAAAIVGEALELAGPGNFVFASRAMRGHIDNIALAAAMARLSAMVPDDVPGATTWKADPPTPHDLRRTCATRLAAAGVPGEDVAAVLNHVRTSITGRVYDHYTRADEKQRALTRWGTILSAILVPSAANNVVALRS